MKKFPENFQFAPTQQASMSGRSCGSPFYLFDGGNGEHDSAATSTTTSSPRSSTGTNRDNNESSNSPLVFGGRALDEIVSGKLTIPMMAPAMAGNQHGYRSTSVPLPSFGPPALPTFFFPLPPRQQAAQTQTPQSSVDYAPWRRQQNNQQQQGQAQQQQQPSNFILTSRNSWTGPSPVSSLSQLRAELDSQDLDNRRDDDSTSSCSDSSDACGECMEGKKSGDSDDCCCRSRHHRCRHNRRRRRHRHHRHKSYDDDRPKSRSARPPPPPTETNDCPTCSRHRLNDDDSARKSSLSTSLTNLGHQKGRFRSLESLQQQYQLMRRSQSPGLMTPQNTGTVGSGLSLIDAYYLTLVERNNQLLQQQRQTIQQQEELQRQLHSQQTAVSLDSPPPLTFALSEINSKPVSGASGSLDLEARVQKLEGDKNALQFQVSLLHDQIENQQQKIHDLERALETKRAQLMETEDALKRELNQRSSLEAHKLDLMTEIGNLHLKQSQLERENLELREQLRAAEITSLKFSVLPQAQPAAISFGGESGASLNFDKLSLDGYLAGNSDLSSLPSSRPPAHSLSTSIKGNPNSSSAVASTSPLHYGFRGDQHQFLSLPRSAKHGRPKPILDSSDPSLKVALEQNLTTRPPSGAQRNSNPMGPAALSNNIGGPANDVSCTSDWPLRDAPFRRPTTPTLDRSRERVVHSCSPSPSFGEPNAGKPRQKGIRNIFSKMKKGSSSTTTASDVNVISAPVISNDFHRGGIRATAGPRLGWSKAIPQGPEFSAPISSERPSKWSTESVCLWLGELGLGTYVPAARSWLQTGETLLSASPADLEKHLGVRNALHKKKILLGVERLRRLDRADSAAFSSSSGWAPWRDPGTTSEGEPPAARLDSTSVLRWLTDVGLSQYREPFTECRVDGPVLDALTIEEATHWLKVTNSFHFLGLRNGIKVLREIDFDVSKLIRAANDDGSGARDENAGGMVSSVSSEMLARWTNSRIIEWLRGIDLAEFADNLKGSGVHGGLLVYEDRFNAEALASVLAIPAGKTLLRRHLSLQFAALVGKSVLQAKREAETNRQSTNPLSPATKIKVSKTQFGLIKRKNKFGEFEPEDLVCPLTSTNAVDNIPLSSSMSTRTPSRENSVARGSSAPPPNVTSALTSNDLPETMIE